MADDTETVTLSAEEIRALILAVLGAHGFDAENAGAIAENMGLVERSGGASHGLFRLKGHVAAVAAGKANGRARPSLARTAPGVLELDGDRGFAPPSHRLGLGPLAEAAAETGLAALAIRRVMHFGALWPEVEALAERGVAALAVTSSPPYVAAGAGRPVFGTNPIAFAWPRPERPPLVFDMATAAMARGEISIAERDGHAVPLGVGVDAEGHATTDPAAILGGGAQLPMGGYKGGLVALMVDLLAGPLIGEITSLEAGARDPMPGLTEVAGQLILALSPERLGARSDGAEALFAAIEAEPATRLPGARRLAARAASAEGGVRVSAALHRELTALVG